MWLCSPAPVKPVEGEEGGKRRGFVWKDQYDIANTMHVSVAAWYTTKHLCGKKRCGLDVAPVDDRRLLYTGSREQTVRAK